MKNILKFFFCFCILIMVNSCTPLIGQNTMSMTDPWLGTVYHASAPPVNGPVAVGDNAGSSASSSVQSDAYYAGEFTEYYYEQAHNENQKGIKFFNKKNWAAAVHHFRNALKFNPNCSVCQENLNNALSELNRERQIRHDEQAAKKARKHNNKIIKQNNKEWVGSVNKDIKTHVKQVNTVRKGLASYVPPLTDNRKEIPEGIILGMSNTYTNNQIKLKKLNSPFSGKAPPFFATSNNDSWTDFFRVASDNMFIGKYTLLRTQVGRDLMNNLQNTHFQRLMAHSNGATVAEALIRSGTIKVDELNIMGGDRSLMNYGAYNELIQKYGVKKVVVWINPADIVPYGTSIAMLNPATDKTQYFEENFKAFSDNYLKNKNSNVEYRWLGGEEFQRGQKFALGDKFWDAHSVDAYFENIRKWYEKNGIKP